MNRQHINRDGKDITVSIVTYNSEADIDVVMQSLQRCSSFYDLTVIVVDNASKDNTTEIVRKNYPWARLIKNNENLGFGGGHNCAIKGIQSKYHIIVNPDVLIPADTINKSVAFMEEHPDVVIMTPFVMNIDGSQQFLPKRNPSIKYLLGGLFEDRIHFCKRLREEYTLKNQTITNPIDVEFCTGAFMVTRSNALQAVGGFDERFFLHFEDADLTRKLRMIGRAVYNPQIKVTHKWHRENRKIDKSFFVALQSMVIYMKKWSGSNV